MRRYNGVTFIIIIPMYKHIFYFFFNNNNAKQQVAAAAAAVITATLSSVNGRTDKLILIIVSRRLANTISRAKLTAAWCPPHRHQCRSNHSRTTIYYYIHRKTCCMYAYLRTGVVYNNNNNKIVFKSAISSRFDEPAPTNVCVKSAPTLYADSTRGKKLRII